MSRMFNPPHPGATLREDVLPALGLTVTQAAQQLGVTRSALSRVLNEHAAISPEMALRIEAWLGIERGGRADVWLARLLMISGKRAKKPSRMSSMHRSKFRLPREPIGDCQPLGQRATESAMIRDR